MNYKKKRFNILGKGFGNMTIALDPLKLCGSQNVKEVRIKLLIK